LDDDGSLFCVKEYRLRRKRRPKKLPKMTLMAMMLSLKLKKKLQRSIMQIKRVVGLLLKLKPSNFSSPEMLPLMMHNLLLNYR
jgi:hypothetical protein